jgi:hypothetical protein
MGAGKQANGEQAGSNKFHEFKTFGSGKWPANAHGLYKNTKGVK